MKEIPNIILKNKPLFKFSYENFKIKVIIFVFIVFYFLFPFHQFKKKKIFTASNGIETFNKQRRFHAALIEK